MKAGSILALFVFLSAACSSPRHVRHDAAQLDGRGSVSVPDEGSEEPYAGISPHRKNYFALFSHNSSAQPGIDDTEWMFQFSLRHDVFDPKHNDHRVAFAYTGRSFWQILESSAPIRTTDHEPELFYEWKSDHTPFSDSDLGVLYRLGVNHQSNGEGGTISRGWNRLVGEVVLHSAGWFKPSVKPEGLTGKLSFRPWLILSKADNNNDVDKYIGHGDISGDLAWEWLSGTQDLRPKLSCRVRHNLRRSGGRGAVEVSWSCGIPRSPSLRFFVQYFNGYGENLLDYDDSSNRVSVGFEFGRAR